MGRAGLDTSLMPRLVTCAGVRYCFELGDGVAAAGVPPPVHYAWGSAELPSPLPPPPPPPPLRDAACEAAAAKDVATLLAERALGPVEGAATAYWQRAAQLRDLLVASVARRVLPTGGGGGAVARPRVGLLFSGGLDSMLLAAAAHAVLPPGEPVALYNVAFANPRVAAAAPMGAGVDPYRCEWHVARAYIKKWMRTGAGTQPLTRQAHPSFGHMAASPTALRAFKDWPSCSGCRARRGRGALYRLMFHLTRWPPTGVVLAWGFGLPSTLTCLFALAGPTCAACWRRWRR